MNSNKTYITKQNDCFDTIAYNAYGDEMLMSEIIQANIQYADVLVFPADIEIVLPNIEAKKQIISSLPVWRK